MELCRETPGDEAGGGVSQKHGEEKNIVKKKGQVWSFFSKVKNLANMYT